VEGTEFPDTFAVIEVAPERADEPPFSSLPWGPELAVLNTISCASPPKRPAMRSEITWKKKRFSQFYLRRSGNLSPTTHQFLHFQVKIKELTNVLFHVPAQSKCQNVRDAGCNTKMLEK
jgi:hypothetical protein